MYCMVLLCVDLALLTRVKEAVFLSNKCDVVVDSEAADATVVLPSIGTNLPYAVCYSISMKGFGR